MDNVLSIWLGKCNLVKKKTLAKRLTKKYVTLSLESTLLYNIEAVIEAVIMGMMAYGDFSNPLWLVT